MKNRARTKFIINERHVRRTYDHSFYEQDTYLSDRRAFTQRSFKLVLSPFGGKYYLTTDSKAQDYLIFADKHSKLILGVFLVNKLRVPSTHVMVM